MRKFLRPTAIFGLLASALIGTSPAQAGPVAGELYYTINTGAPNVRSVSFNFDGASTLTLGTSQNIATVGSADGIAGNPNDPNMLIVGGGGPQIHNINRFTGAVSTTASPVDSSHLEVATPNVVLTSANPGFLARHTIGLTGTLGGGTQIVLTGDNTEVTQVITTPSGFFYTSSTAAGTGNFGTLTFNTGNPETAT